VDVRAPHVLAARDWRNVVVRFVFSDVPPASPPPSLIVMREHGINWFFARVLRTRVMVWTDALPQRNCSRFSRLFPLP